MIVGKEYLQIEMAARGCISGRLREWPILMNALRRIGCDVTGDEGAAEVRILCKKILNEEQEVPDDCA